MKKYNIIKIPNKKEELPETKKGNPSLDYFKLSKYPLSNRIANRIYHYHYQDREILHKWWSMKELIYLWKISHPWWKKYL